MKKYTDQEIIEYVKNSTSITQILKKLNLTPSGGNFYTIKRKILLLCLDTSHFTGQGYLKGKNHNWAKETPLKDILVEKSTYGGGGRHLKKKLFKAGLLEDKCYQCGLTFWRGEKLSLEIEHINGNHFDNRIENLTILCPNCHSLTPTYRGRKLRGNKRSLPKKNICLKCGSERSKNSKSGLCIKCVKKRKVENRPSKEQLLKEISESNFCAVGRKYGVTDNAIRKWLKQI